MRSLALAPFILFTSLACSLPGGEARLVLEDIAAGPGPSPLKAQTPAPQYQTIHYRQAGKTYRADLYTPDEAAVRAGLVLVPGLAEAGRHDVRLVAFARTLARAHFAVLVPDIENLRRLRIDPDDAAHISTAFTQLQTRRETDTTLPLGIAAFSYAAGPAIQAAMHPAIRDRVDFVLTIGAYYRLTDTLRFLTTGHLELEGQDRYRQPNAYGKLVFALSTLELLEKAADRKLFRHMIELKRADPKADISHLVEGLGDQGHRLYRLLDNRQAEAFETLLGELPEAIRTRMAELDLANKDLTQLKAKLVLVHGMDDSLIPYSESQALAAARPGHHTQLFVIKGMSHIDVGARDFDRQALWRAVNAFLQVRQ